MKVRWRLFLHVLQPGIDALVEDTPHVREAEEMLSKQVLAKILNKVD